MITRRHLLAGAAAAGVTAGLAACSTGGSPNSAGNPAASTGKTSALPTFRAFDKVTADLAGDPALGIPSGYYSYPAQPPAVTAYPLPQTKPITVLTQGTPTGTPLAQSARWKALCADLGNDVQVTFGGTTEYTAKFQTTMAGNELPDLVMMDAAPELPKLLAAKFTDLGEFLGGDKSADYPGLASIPTTAWSVSMLNGQLWGIPQARPPAGLIMSTRGDLLAAKGIKKDQSPADGAELLAFFKEITNPKEPQFAMGALPTTWLMNILLEMVDAPNVWQQTDGKFVHAMETPQYAAAIQHAKEFWDAGVLHPNSFSDPGSNSTWWQGGLTQVYVQGFPNWLYFTQRQPHFDLGLIDIPKWDGGGLAAKHASTPAYNAYAAVSKQASPDRVREILRVLDYIAAPYGTQEYLRGNYGLEGTHYTMVDGVPTSTKAIIDEPTVLTYFGSQALAYLTGPRGLVDREHEYLTKIMPTAKHNAALGLYSATASSKATAFTRKATDVVGAIIQGRSQLGEWDSLVKEWQGGIGKDMRSEYEQAFAEGANR